MDEPHLSSSPERDSSSPHRDEATHTFDTPTDTGEDTDELPEKKVTVSGRILITLIHIYQAAISPWLGHNCRFEPTCSNYTLEAVKEWGALKGGWMGLRRVFRCHPWGGSGYDPLPKKSKKN